jgi:hypothetical protein
MRMSLNSFFKIESSQIRGIFWSRRYLIGSLRGIICAGEWRSLRGGRPPVLPDSGFCWQSPLVSPIFCQALGSQKDER